MFTGSGEREAGHGPAFLVSGDERCGRTGEGAFDVRDQFSGLLLFPDILSEQDDSAEAFGAQPRGSFAREFGVGDANYEHLPDFFAMPHGCTFPRTAFPCLPRAP